MSDFVQELKLRFKDNLHTQIESKYLTDFVGSHIGCAKALVFAKNKQDVIDAVCLCHKYQEPFLVRGSGTNLVGATIPQGGLVIDLSSMNHILNLDTDNMCVEVECGVLLNDLQEYVEARNLFYPPDPAERQSTIGGNIATNAGGMRAVKYGVTRDFVLALDVVLSNGQNITLGSKNLKDSTGLSLKHLFIGSEGSLGIIVGATLKLLVKPKCTQNLILAFDSLKAGISSVKTMMQSGLNLTACEFVEKKVIALGERYLNKSFPCQQAKAYLIVTFDGDNLDVEHKVKATYELMKDKCLEVILLNDEKLTQDVWDIRKALAKSVKDSGVWEPVDTVVPIDKIAPFVESIDNIAKEDNIRILAFGHAGDGNVHLCVMKDDIADDKWDSVLDATLDKIFDLAYSMGGLISAEHGVGKSKRKYFYKHCANTNLELMQQIKAVFDQNLQINPHSGYAK